jgi:hypothetical protein
MLVTARKLNNLDENELSTEKIDSPLELDAGVTLPTISEMNEIEDKPGKKAD